MWWFRKNYTVQGGYIPEVGGYNINQVEYCTEEMFMFFGQHKDVTLKYFVAIYWCFSRMAPIASGTLYMLTLSCLVCFAGLFVAEQLL